MRWVLVVLCACGRIAFDARSDATSADAYTGCPVVAAGLGRQHTCAIDARGQLWCFGYNGLGQAQPGGPEHVLAPAQIALAATPVEVHGGRFFTCARLVDGNVSCWGDGSEGERGDGTFTIGGAPSTVALGAERAAALSVGARTACIIRESDRAVMCWGAGEFFQLGRMFTGPGPTPVLVAGTAGTKHLEVGHRHVCVVDANDVTRCWGRNKYGQLGVFDMMDRQMSIAVTPVTEATQISGAGMSTCAVERSGNVQCWGINDHAQLGTGDFDFHAGATAVPISSVVEVATTSFGSCARTNDGGLLCWGQTAPGLDGIAPIPRASRFTNVTAVSSGAYHVCSLHDGALTCWGNNGSAQLGRGTISSAIAPREVTLPGPVTSFEVGFSTACAVANGRAYCWGDNDWAQIGGGSLARASAPTEVLTSISVEGVTIERDHACAWGGGVVECWGRSSYALGIPPTPTKRQETPVRVPGLSGVTSVSAGEAHVCAIASGTVVCWGIGTGGQLGDGLTTSSMTPVSTGITNATKLAAGSYYNCAIASGVVSCWGINGVGELGDGTQVQRAAPVTINVPGGPVIDIAAGLQSTCAINVAGALYCWGTAANDELGQGDTGNRLTPQLVSLPGPAVGIAIASHGACARLASGDVYCWGRRHLAGAGTDDRSPTPVLVPALAGASRIERSAGGMCAIIDSQLRCSGSSELAADREAIELDASGAPAAIPPCP